MTVSVLPLIVPEFGLFAGCPFSPHCCLPLPDFLWKSLRISVPYSADTFLDSRWPPRQLHIIFCFSCHFQNLSIISGLVLPGWRCKLSVQKILVDFQRIKAKILFELLGSESQTITQGQFKVSYDQPIKAIFGALGSGWKIKIGY